MLLLSEAYFFDSPAPHYQEQTIMVRKKHARSFWDVGRFDNATRPLLPEVMIPACAFRIHRLG